MNNHWMPLRIGDYLRRTRHLSAEQHGGFLLLMMEYWTRSGSLPADDQQLARIAGMTPRQWLKSKSTIQCLFDNGWTLPDLDAEIKRAADVSAKYADRARKGAQGLWAKRNASSAATGDASSMLGASQPQPQPQEDSPSESEATSAPPADAGGSIDQKFSKFMVAYPRRDGRNPVKPARDRFAAKVRRGADPDAIIAAAKAYASECDRLNKAGTEFVKQAQFWLNQEPWLDAQAMPKPAAAPTTRVKVFVGTPQWDAHVKRWRETRGTDPPQIDVRDDAGRIRRGYLFETEFPPEPQKIAA